MAIMPEIAAKEICAALGLSEVVGLTLRMRVGEITTVFVEYFPTCEDMKRVNEVLKRYKLVPLEEDNEQRNGTNQAS